MRGRPTDGNAATAAGASPAAAPAAEPVSTLATRPELSIIIVSYQTREHLRNCLRSIFGSRQRTRYEVRVVDNASTDGSAEMVAREFPAVHLVRNTENVGFARANNQALAEARGEFLLLLNPDTLVPDAALDTCIDFLREHPEAGIVGCRLVRADGSLDLACRRSFPTPFDGFCRATGLSALFPRSRLFARYNLTYLDEHRTTEVDAVNGAFMLVRAEAARAVGPLDERFFMYMEDLDWCWRFRAAGWKVYYHPAATVVHLKGESGKQRSSEMIRAFFDSMVLFCRKHYRATPLGRYTYPAVLLGIRTWMVATLLRNALRAEKRVTP